MKTRTPYDILDEIAKDHIPNDINLSENILMRVRKEKQTMKHLRINLVCGILLAALLIVTIKVPVVAHAIQRFFGYLPGTGLVETTGEIYFLEEPVVRNYDGTTISILQIVADKTQTIITLQIENLPLIVNADETNERVCSDLPTLILPDGSTYTGNSTDMDIWSTGYRRKIIYPALPENALIGRLKISCLELTSADIGVDGWNIPFELVPAPHDLQIYPLERFPTPTEQYELEEKTLNDSDEVLPDISDFHLIIEQKGITEDEILVTGQLKTDISNIHLLYIDPEEIHLRDSKNNDIAMDADFDIIAELYQKGNSSEIPLAYHIHGPFEPGESVLSVDSVWFSVEHPIEFTLDVGENPQPGQEWQIDLPFQFAGKTARLTSVKMNELADGYTFSVDTTDDFHIISIIDQDHEILGGGGNYDSITVSYNGIAPVGELNLIVSGFEIRMDGPWQMQIELPALQNQTLPPAYSTACLTANQWYEVLQQNSVSNKPPVMGKLMLYQLVGPEYHYWIAKADLQNQQTDLLTNGEDPSLSPDGNRVVYATEQGLSVRNMATGETTLINGTTKKDREPIWSPDGTQIVFTHGPESGLIDGPGTYQLMLTSLDGNLPRTLLENSDANIAQTWAADGKSIYFIVKSADGAIVKRIALQNGSIQSIFTISYINAGITLSPNGNKFAYEDMLPGDRYAIFIADIDGKNPILIADMYPLVATHPKWSPDGEWLMISVHDSDISEINPIMTMINVNTCEVIPLPNLSGYLNTWLP